MIPSNLIMLMGWSCQAGFVTTPIFCVIYIIIQCRLRHILYSVMVSSYSVHLCWNWLYIYIKYSTHLCHLSLYMYIYIYISCIYIYIMYIYIYHTYIHAYTHIYIIIHRHRQSVPATGRTWKTSWFARPSTPGSCRMRLRSGGCSRTQIDIFGAIEHPTIPQTRL